MCYNLLNIFIIFEEDKMKKFTKIIALLMVAVLTLACFAACSGAQEPTTTEPASKADDTGAKVSQAIADGVLTVGTNAAFPPFEYAGADGTPDGFDIALIKEVGKLLDVDVKVVDMEFNSLVESVGSKIDAAIAGMTVKPEREETVDFSESYYEATQYVLVLKDNTDITSVASLNGKSIGTQLGTTGQFAAEDEVENADVRTYDKAVDAVNDLVNGRVDAVIIDRNPAQVFASEYDTIKIIGEDFFAPEQYAIALPEGDALLKAAVDEALATIKSNGTFDALVAQYIEEK